jgi:2-(1,2-epoxy-1,2-dihydrophenyl)acetyl-CoA isomerase
MASDVERRVEDGIAWLTMRKPDTRNAVEPDFMEELSGALDTLPDGIGALVLAGEGPAFCVGVNLGLTQRLLSDGDVGELHRLLAVMHSIARKLRALPVPTVAAVEGAAAGAGVGLACACDLRVVGASTIFVPGFQALGLSPDSGTSFHLARALGSPAAIATFLRNRRITADELLACRLADEVVPDGEVWAAAQRLAGEVAGAAPRALLATRGLIDAAGTHSFDEHLDAEEATIKELLPTADVAEGVSAFLERRRPKFTGA